MNPRFIDYKSGDAERAATINTEIKAAEAHFKASPASTVDILKKWLRDRRAPNSRFKAWYVATLIIIGELAGCASDRAIESYLNRNRRVIGLFLDLSPGIPSHKTLSRFRKTIVPESADQALRAQFEALGGAPEGAGAIWSLDGTATRAAGSKGEAGGPPYSLDGVDQATGLSMVCLPVPQKTSEVTVLRDYVRTGAVRSKVITADAAHFNSETLRALLRAGAGFCLPVKKRNGSGATADRRIREAILGRMTGRDRRLFGLDGELGPKKACRLEWRPEGRVEYHSTREKNRGRVEIRKIWHINDAAGVLDPEAYPGVESVSWVKSYRIEKKRGQGGSNPHVEVSLSEYGIASSFAAAPETVLAVKRGEWAVEAMHRVKDVDLREDWRTYRGTDAVGVSAALRRMEYNLLVMSGDCLPQAGRTYQERIQYLAANPADLVMMVTGYNERYPEIMKNLKFSEMVELELREKKERTPKTAVKCNEVSGSFSDILPQKPEP